jgi:hypothetical protein
MQSSTIVRRSGAAREAIAHQSERNLRKGIGKERKGALSVTCWKIAALR